MDKYSIIEITELIKSLSISNVKNFKYGELNIEFFTNEDFFPKYSLPVSEEMNKEIDKTADHAGKAHLESEVKRELERLYYEDPSGYEDAVLEGLIVKEEIKESESTPE